MLFLISTLFASLATAYRPFTITSLSTHQPIGNPDGQVNFYNIAFTVSSINEADRINKTAECRISWADNGWQQSEAYSTYVPTGRWIPCGDSEYSFQLFPYFSIGNFTLAVQQSFSDVASHGITPSILASGSTHVTNTTSAYTCDMNPKEVQYIQHASGDCCIPSFSPAVQILVTTSEVVPPPCQVGQLINTTFISTAVTKPGQSLLLVGGSLELGSWDVSNAIPMISNDNDGSLNTPDWRVSVEIPAGTSLEYKYVLVNTDGTKEWECCGNRQFEALAGWCWQTAGNNPDVFRSGGSVVQ